MSSRLGGTDGVGKITAVEMAKRNATIILPCRNLQKGTDKDVTSKILD